MAIIDVHHHVWDLSNSPYAWLQAPTWDAIRKNHDYASLLPELDACGVDKTIIVQADNTVGDNLFGQATSLAEERVAGFVGWVPLNQPDAVPAMLDQLQVNPKFVGMRHVLTFEEDDRWVMQPAVLRSLRELERRQLTFEVTSDRLAHLALVPELAQAFPDLHIVVNHIGKPPIGARGWEPWASTLARAAEFPKVFAKLSGLTTPYRPEWNATDFQPYIDHALACFGAARLMYGSNWPVTLVAGSYRKQWDAMRATLAALPAAELAEIYGGTAARCYRLKL